ncbi:mannose-1-phosphate guanylyltransferase [Cytophagaceae bacterium YF14B1]|uniref:mannose-1-phosphate guanylyltransferase n=1 Tax=Xanthocytophaga flava TaxID=3048013 RepID=A0AAE3QU67_9BACT|nr:mannose-1-phosphate guanylyltransferase [Xanthocytophaga flavus]MDJ1483341.1 mannose-1-phosphate guanylyltransferase [Xanthocytophaga flavus]
MSKNNYVIIMAGGVGTRFWPFSRTSNPKQFHDVLGTGRTLLQQTADRFDGICPPENIYIVTSAEYRDLVKQQLPQLSYDQILLEPARRNTAPCIAYAAYKIAHKDPHANLVIAPADHIILKEEAFRADIQKALKATTETNKIVTLGIKPSRPDTGYGYIQFHPEDGEDVLKVKTFTEKPSLEYAKKFIESGDYVWNAGIFVWNAQTVTQNFLQYLPDIAEAFEDGKPFYFTTEESTYIDKAYSWCKSISIDVGIMEKADKAGDVYVVLSDFGWSDLGTWKSLYEVSDKDEHENVIDGSVMLYDTKNCIIKTPKDRLIAINGLDGFIVAEYDNVLLICRKDDEQKVKEFVNDAKNKGDEFV